MCRWLNTRTVCLVLAASMGLLKCSSLAWAGSLATPKTPQREALRVTYTPDPDASVSVDEVLVTVATLSGKPAEADREIEVVLYVSAYYGQSTAFAARVKLPQGSRSANSKIYINQPANYMQWAVDIREDGRSLVLPRAPASMANSQEKKNVLEILANPANTGNAITAVDSVSKVIADYSTLAKAPTDWRGYLAYDAVILEAGQLESAARQQLRAWCTYVLAGGCLIIQASDSTPSTLQGLYQKLLEARSEQLDAQPPGEASSPWNTVFVQGLTIGARRQLGAGAITVYSDGSALSKVNWLELAGGRNQERLSEVANSGSLDQEWFWRNLVQTVGKTPIWAFVGFIVLFVLMVGPVLLRITTRLQHRTLLLVLIPAVSLVATLAFLLYNVTREGFDTRGRVAAIQWIDTGSGAGFVWSRQSYFSGAPPREGLLFPSGTFLKPIVEEISTQGRWQDPRDKLAAYLSESDQTIQLSAWFVPRTQLQLLAGNRCDDASLPLKIEPVDGELIRITNTTAATLPVVVLKQSAQVVYMAESLAAGETRELRPESPSKIESSLRDINKQLQPKAPPEIDVNAQYGYSRRGYYAYYSSLATTDPLEVELRRFGLDRLSDYGFWIVSHQLPQSPLPLEPTAYAMERNFLITTGTTRW